MPQVDVTAFLQGVSNAHDEKPYLVDEQLYVLICQAVHNISFAGPVKRQVCNYNALLRTLASIHGDWLELSTLWSYLGESLQSGLCVAKQEQ